MKKRKDIKKHIPRHSSNSVLIKHLLNTIAREKAKNNRIISGDNPNSANNVKGGD